MKTHSTFTKGIVTCLVLSLFFLISCKKDPNPVIQETRISQLNVLQIYDGKIQASDTFRITYNHYGDPVEVRPNQISTGVQRIVIGYDKQRRIIAVIYAYTNNGFYESHSYKYNDSRKEVTDSVHYFGDFDPVTFEISNLHTSLTFENKLTFDNQQRILKIVTTPYVYTYDGYATTTYTYNNAGNVSKINTSVNSPAQGNSSTDRFPTYDNKINPHRLHAVWQLIDYDYNRNNCVKVDLYNKLGLPLKMDYSIYGSSMNNRPLLGLPFSNFEFVYE